MNLKDLKPAEYNPRKITDEQLAKLKKSLVEFGDLSGIVYNRRSGNVIGGHQRLKCLPPDAKIEKKDLKEKSKTGTVAHGFVIINNEKYTYREVDWDDPTEKMANLAANKHGGEWDDDKLSELLQELSEMPIFDADITGFDSAEIDEILSQITKEGQIDDDEVPEVPAEPITKTGDLYILGSHRLLCGDCTVITQLELLMGGGTVKMVFTDPPYGIDYSGGRTQVVEKKPCGKITGDADVDISRFIKAILNLAGTKDYYICLSPINIKDVLPLFVAYDGIIIWKKPQPGLGYQWIRRYCEFIVFGTQRKKAKNDPSEFDFWDIPTDTKTEYEHGTQKPVALALRAIQFSSVHNDIIADPFLGSGSTLIACEKTGRICYGMEIDPHYCDVIVTRFCKYTGNNKITKNGEMIEWPL